MSVEGNTPQILDTIEAFLNTAERRRLDIDMDSTTQYGLAPNALVLKGREIGIGRFRSRWRETSALTRRYRRDHNIDNVIPVFVVDPCHDKWCRVIPASMSDLKLPLDFLSSQLMTMVDWQSEMIDNGQTVVGNQWQLAQLSINAYVAKSGDVEPLRNHPPRGGGVRVPVI